MAVRRRFDRVSALNYLLNNANFRDIYRKNPADLGTAQLKRYAAATWTANELEGRDVTMGELRGHVLSESHPGRKPKQAPPDWQPRERVKMGEWFVPVDAGRGRVGPGMTILRTSGEATAVRFLAKVAGWGDAVSLNLMGPRKGQVAQILRHYGWSAERLLEAAGYDLRVTRRGGKVYYFPRRRPDTPGLEAFLLAYLAQLYPRRKQWGRIAVYEIEWLLTAYPDTTEVPAFAHER